MPPRKSKGPPKAIPAGADPVEEARIRSENLERENERKKSLVEHEAMRRSVLAKQLEEVKMDHQEVVDERRAVISDITREFKVQQNEFQRQQAELKAYVDLLSAKLAETQLKIRHTRDKFERQKHQRDETIQKNIVKAEQMAQEFRDMLKGTLVKMSDRIEMARESDEMQLGNDGN